jgi:hypothetical protein
MTVSIMFGFYGEGNTDYAFIKQLVERVIIDLVPDADVLPVLEYKSSAQKQIEKIADVAQQAQGLFFLVIHLDADGRNLSRALEERFDPARAAIEGNLQFIQHLVPVVPIKMSEAWMLVDFEAFRKVTHTKLSANALDFPEQPHMVESINSKSVFEAAVRNCVKRRTKLEPTLLHGPLAETINLELLRKVPAYQEFERRLLETLTTLRLVED